MKIKYLSLLIFIMASARMQTAYAQDSAPMVLTVDAAVKIALDNNLSLLRSALDVQAKKRAALSSWNSLLPSVNAAALISRPSSVTGPIEPASRDVWTPGFSLSASVTISAAVVGSVKKARSDYELGLISYESARQELELSTRKLFYQILLLDANSELAVQNFKSAEGRYAQSAALVRAGQAPRLDELSARVDMENSRPAMRNAEMLYENALDSLKTILALPADAALSLEGSLAGSIAGNYYTGLTAIESESLEAAGLRKSIQSLEAQRNSVRNGAYIPNLRLSWASSPLYSVQNGTWSDNGAFSVSLGISLDNFLPWSLAKIQMGNLDDSIRSAQIQLAEALRGRENRVSQNMRTVERILESLEATSLNIELAETSYDMYGDAYIRGAADYQQLRSAGDSLEQAKNRFLQEQYSLISALLDLEKELNIPFNTLF